MSSFQRIPRSYVDPVSWGRDEAGRRQRVDDGPRPFRSIGSRFTVVIGYTDLAASYQVRL
jgi:hypothetical protein